MHVQRKSQLCMRASVVRPREGGGGGRAARAGGGGGEGGEREIDRERETCAECTTVTHLYISHGFPA